MICLMDGRLLRVAWVCMYTFTHLSDHPPPQYKPTNHPTNQQQLRIDPPYTRAEIKTLDASAKADFIDRLGNMVRPSVCPSIRALLASLVYARR